MSRLKFGQFNDSFPPTIDGVAQAVKNYAGVLHEKYCDVTVVTPEYKGVEDNYPFEVFRYHSIPLDKKIGYRAGNPFSIETLIRLRHKRFNLMHVHAPFASSVLVQNINRFPRVPVVLTYHTKFDIDIAKRVRLSGFRKIAMRFVLENINNADEIWVVTEGCGKALRNIGYRGGYRVMENGTDFAFGKAETDKVDELRKKYDIRDDEFVFLFVGRMMWYKNIRIILDTLKIAKSKGVPFRAFMIGDGFDAPKIREYAEEIGISDQTIFTGPIYDREYLRVFFSLADMFLFPSTYDTSGIVVKEAAACSCPALLIRDSCAAEGVQHDFSGYLAEESADSCAEVLVNACQSRDNIKQVGENAGKHVYLSWDTAVDRAYKRYVEILETDPKNLPYNSKARWV
ncbi:MAG: glycosyltransferase [Oscillospiraceae bacterium]|nr:glycosyltransferase [Oscillospiraceae bacterium]MDD4414740.1 glycosyltransferase [Oscillospiraceae bacterium]